ncbi:haloacid dehalogenase, partial [Fusobacterium mortiferum]|nr:haloacid dehalogenase [Fusobacterium mortiferum]
MENKKLYLFDLDGTLLLGDQVIDGAIEAINK